MFKEYYNNLTGFQKAKYLIIIIYFILNIILLIVSMNMSVDNLKFMLKVGRYSDYMRYYALANLILFLTVIGMYYKELRGLRNSLKKSDEEINKLKSKLYDIEEGKKQPPPAPEEKN